MDESSDRADVSQKSIDPRRIVALLLAIAVACACLGLLGRFAWWLEPLSHFAMHYAIVLLCVTRIAFRLGRKGLAVAAGILALLRHPREHMAAV